MTTSQEIINTLETICKSNGYFYVWYYFYLQYNIGYSSCDAILNIEELLLVLSLIPHPIDLTLINQRDFDILKSETNKLMKDLHISNKQYMAEPLMYQGNGATLSQYITLIDKFYSLDHDWLKIKGYNTKMLSELFVYLFWLNSIKLNEYFIATKLEPTDIANFSIHTVSNLLSTQIFSRQDLVHWADADIEDFLNKFVYDPKLTEYNFLNIGHHNQIWRYPLIQLSQDKYLISDFHNFAKSLYDRFFFVTMQDESYCDKANQNRGDMGEKIVYDNLSKIFTQNKIMQNVGIKKSQKDVSDIDVVCINNDVAICIFVKTKRWTLLSKSGDSQSMNKDYNDMVLGSLKQGIRVKKAILHDKHHQYTCNDNDVTSTFNNDIKKVYTISVIFENFPTANLCHIMGKYTQNIDRLQNDENTIVMTIFDLEQILYFIKSPQQLIDYLNFRDSRKIAAEEPDYLGFFLFAKNINNNTSDMLYIYKDYGQKVNNIFNDYCNQNLLEKLQPIHLTYLEQYHKQDI